MPALLALVFAAAPVADRARLVPSLKLLNVAEANAWDLDDPHVAVEGVLRTASVLEPGASRRVRAASERLSKLPPPPNTWTGRQGVQARLARLVAPHDRALRDEILRRAVAEADAALAMPELWKVPPRERPIEGNPQRELGSYKREFAFRRRLWEAVASHAADPVAGLAGLRAVFADARSAGTAYRGCIIGTYESDLRLELAELDPELLPAVPPLETDRRSEASACGHSAADRWREGRRDRFTGLLARYAVENGAGLQEVFEVLKHYDLDAAWALAQKLPVEGGPTVQRAPILHSLIAEMAWRDPEGALELAELEPGDGWVSAVARVWAYKRPLQIERAIETLRHESTRNQLRGEAADELAWRAAGHLPRDSARAMPPFPGMPAR